MAKTIESKNWEFILYPDSTSYNLQEEISKIVERFPGCSWAYALHDKDVKAETGELKKPHIHFMVRHDTNVRLSTLQNDFPECSSQISKIHNWRKAVRYLVHVDDPDKYLYDVGIISSNFNHLQFFSDLDQEGKAAEIFNYIYTTHCTNAIELTAWCFQNRLYSELRRGWALWSCIMRENSEN